MSDEDELDNLLNDIESSDSDRLHDSSDNDSDMDDSDMDSDTDDTSVPDVEIEEQVIMSDDDTMSSDENDAGITQAEVYENLKRIGELEDEKQKIQDELRERTEQLRSVLRHIDRSSILYKMLQSALADSSPKAPAASTTKKTASKAAPKKKATKKKGRRKS